MQSQHSTFLLWGGSGWIGEQMIRLLQARPSTTVISAQSRLEDRCHIKE